MVKNHRHLTLPHHGAFHAAWRRVRAGYKLANAATNHVLGALLKLLVLCYFLFAGLFLGLRYLVLPHIDIYKGGIEQLASRAIGLQVSIDRIYASWNGLRPSLFLGDVVIRDKDQRKALSLPSVSATLSWWTVLSASLRFDNLEIIRPDLDIRRDQDGKLYVAGMFIDQNKGGDGAGFDWLLSQREILIRDGKLRWTDARRNAPELELTGVNLMLRNRWRQHQLGLQATPAARFGAPLDVRADFSHPAFARRISNINFWKGELYAELKNTDLAIWKAYVDYPIEVQQGKGSVRAWLNLDHAKLANFTADLTLSDVVARLGKGLPPLALRQVNGRISAHEDFDPARETETPTFGAHGHAIALNDFSLETQDGLKLAPTTINESFAPAFKDRPEKTAIQASSLDLQTLADFAGRLPLSAAQRQLLLDFSPRGKLKDFAAEWQGAYPDLISYKFKGEFVELALHAQSPRPGRPKVGKIPAQAPVPGIPGFENLTGRIDADVRGGSFSLASENFKLQLPGYFADPVMLFDQLKMQANWNFTNKDQLLFQVGKMDFLQDGLLASLSGKHLMSLKPQNGKTLGNIDLEGKISGFELKKIDRYLPLQAPEGLRAWLTGALLDGKAQDASIRLKGDLASFPFRKEGPNDKSKGEFNVSGRLENAKLDYVPGKFAKDGKSALWPECEEINGSFVFDGTRMEIMGETAKTHGIALSHVKAVIPDLSSKDMLLDIDGNASGNLQKFIRYANVSPVSDWIANFTEDTKTDGDAKLALKLRLPLARLLDAKVAGTLQFVNDDVVLQDGIPLLSQVNGKLEFSETGFNLNGLSANFLGGAVAIAGGTQRDGGTQVKANGSVSSEGIQKTYPSPAMRRLADLITGSTYYAVTINAKKHQSEIVLESNLQGIALKFPVPLRKTANESMPFKFSLTGLASDDAATLRDEIKLTLGSALAARYQRQRKAGKNAAWHVVAGGIGVNTPAPEPDGGLVINANMHSLNVDAWRNVAALIVSGPQTAENPPANAAAEQPKADVASVAPQEQTIGEHSDELNIAQYIDPEVLAARASELIIMGKKLENVVVGASHDKGVWQANIDSTQVSGHVAWRQSATGRGLGRVTARLAQLIIPQSAATEVSELLEGKSLTTQIPALDVMADNFELFNKKLGRLEVNANNVRGPVGREWRINKLTLINPDAELTAKGNWNSKEGGSLTNLAYTLDFVDAGKFLERFGFAHILRGGKGKMDGELNWKGLPFSLDIPTLSGKINLNMEAGQFLKVEPGAAKLLSVLNLQALPRLLKLDFHDVFSEGFAFDGITASAIISNGLATTDNLKMRSVNATVLMDGTADIAKETQDLHVAVIPEMNLGTASMVYALAVNPVIGLGSFLANLFLRNPLMKAFTFQYHVTGPWKDPTVTKIDAKGARTTPAKEGIPNR